MFFGDRDLVVNNYVIGASCRRISSSEKKNSLSRAHSRRERDDVNLRTDTKSASVSFPYAFTCFLEASTLCI
jgi:hypothetical protein